MLKYFIQCHSLPVALIKHCFLSVPQHGQSFVVSIHPQTSIDLGIEVMLIIWWYLIHVYRIVNILLKRALPLFFQFDTIFNLISLEFVFWFSIVFSPYWTEMFWDWSFRRGRYGLIPSAFLLFYSPFYWGQWFRKEPLCLCMGRCEQLAFLIPVWSEEHLSPGYFSFPRFSQDFLCCLNPVPQF